MVSMITKSVSPFGALGVTGTAHEVERVPVDLAGRDVLVEGQRPSIRPEAHGEQEPGVPRVEDTAERHRVAAFGLALAGLGHELEQLTTQFIGDGTHVVEALDPTALLLDPVVALHAMTSSTCPGG